MCANDLVSKSLHSSEDWGRNVKVKFVSLCRTADNSSGAFSVSFMGTSELTERRAAVVR